MPESKNYVQKKLAEYITLQGETHTLQQWLDKAGLAYGGYKARLGRGLTIEQALLTPKQKAGREAVYYVPHIEKKTRLVRRFVRNGSNAGTWRMVEEEYDDAEALSYAVPDAQV